jgi:hypothetical protein
MLFSLGRVVATPGALDHLHANAVCFQSLLTRHANGDWGSLSRGDKGMNDIAVTEGARILSAYSVADVRVYVITEADRSYTTLLLASEY